MNDAEQNIEILRLKEVISKAKTHFEHLRSGARVEANICFANGLVKDREGWRGMAMAYGNAIDLLNNLEKV